MHDLAIVGAGPAGLATAYHLRDLDLDLVVLEAGDDVGGRTLSVPVGGFMANTGAEFIYRGTPAEELAAELGIATVPFRPATYGIHVNGVTVVDADNGRLIDRLPVSDLARQQLRSFVTVALEEYAALTRGGRLTEGASQLVDETIADRLIGLEPEVAEIITRAVVGGSVADPSDLSAQYALRYFASYLAHETENRLYPLDGMQSIPTAMAARLSPETIRVNSPVTQVRPDPDGDGYLLDVADRDCVRAKEVVLAVPAPVAVRIAPQLPDWKRQALTIAKTPGATTLCVTVDVTGLDHITDWAFVTVTGKAFDAIINCVPGDTRTTADGRRITQFVCYGNSARYRPDLVASAAGVNAWTDDFLAVAPELRGRVLGSHLQTWEHCFALLTPERGAALAQLQASVDGLHFAGDHTSATAGTHGAYTEARRVADLIRAR